MWTQNKKRWIIYSIIVVAVALVGYLFYYYLWQRVAVVVAFNSDVPESVALQTLSRYKDGIETRSPKEYDWNFFNLYAGFRFKTIEFGTCRWCAYVMKDNIAAEATVRKVAIIEHPPSPEEDKQFYDYLRSHPEIYPQ